jgi:hypothetical protein
MAKMFYQESIGPGFFQGIGEDDEAIPFELPARKNTVVIDGVRQPNDDAVVPDENGRGGGNS